MVTIAILILLAVVIAYEAELPQPAKIVMLIVDLLLLVLLLFGGSLHVPVR